MSKEPILPADTADVDKAVKDAAAAQKTWAQSTFDERRRVLRTILQHVLTHQEEIVDTACLDSGKTRIDASLGEILVTTEKLQWTIKHGERALRPSKRPTNLLMCYKTNTVIYEPLGVITACVSWNYPFHNFIGPVISALFTGNAIVVKPSEQTAWSSLYYTKIVKEVLKACGHSPDLVQMVVCLPKLADYVTSHPGLSHITFIGSRPVAHKVLAAAAKSLTPVCVELGGKDPAIVLDDHKTIANVENVAAILLRGVFQSAGQNCIGIERVIALPGIYDKLVDVILPKVQAIRLGSTLLHPEALDTGSMISDRNFQYLEVLVERAVRDGAKLLHGGRRFRHPEYPNGHYFMPTLLINVTDDMQIANEELFAPVFLVMRARDVSRAIKLANSTSYALGSSVFGRNKADVDRCIKEVKAGMVSVNDFAAYYAVGLPFGGVGGSGYGRFGGEEGLRSLCNVKSICDESSWAKTLGICTKIPVQLQYPIANNEIGWQLCRGVVETGYAPGVAQKIEGLQKLVGAVVPLLAKYINSNET